MTLLTKRTIPENQGRTLLYVILDPCIIRIYTVMVPTGAHKCIEISLYTQLTPTCFSQPYGNLERYKIQKFVFYIPQDGHMVG
jgi:hypothetical protein